MSEWQEVRLGDVLDKIVGGGTPSKENPSYWDGGDIFWCSVKDMSDDKFRILQTKDTITLDGLNNSSANLIPKGTVITATRMGLGRAFINETDMAINQDLKALIPNSNINNKYLLWTIILYRNYIEMLGNGATVKGIRLETLKNIKINLPPLPAQQKIAKILSNYDDLIENNLKRIKLLEESARLTYEEWFLRFRIDGKKLEIDSDTGLPFGWECKLMKDFGEVVTGKTPSTDNESYYGGDIPFVKTPSMHGNTYTLETADYLTNLGANSQQNKFLSKNSLMVSCIGTAGVYSLVAGNCQTNQQINSIRFYKDEYTFYIYGFAGHLTNVLDAIGSNGATMTNVNKTKFENIKAPMPSIDLLERFHNTFNSNFESILNIMKQNQLLKEARDILLPRLMTGMIDTDDMDIAI